MELHQFIKILWWFQDRGSSVAFFLLLILVVQTRVMPGSYLGEVEHSGQLISQPPGHIMFLFLLDENFMKNQEEQAEVVHHVEVVDVQDVCTCLYGFVPHIIPACHKIFIQTWPVTVSPMFGWPYSAQSVGKEGVLQNLWPMLDQHCRGCITTDSLLFLEKA